MDLTRVRLALLPTPVVAADRLSAELGCAPVWVKRDDLTGFGVSGNKARPLELLLGDALARGCDLLVTGGGPDSNFVAAAALAARVAGLDCELLVTGRPGAEPSRNVALALAAGADVRPLGHNRRELIDDAVADAAARHTARGRRPVALPRGGSTPLGAAGFARAAHELAGQVAAGLLPEPALLVIAVGSGGSAAGLLAGLAGTGPRSPVLRGPVLRGPVLRCPVLGVSVSRPPDRARATVLDLARGCSELLGTAGPDPDALEIVDARGPGFGVAAPGDRAAAATALRTEGLLLDDTYGAKAFAVLLDRLRTGVDGPVLYWHTGGVVSALDHLPTRGAHP